MSLVPGINKICSQIVKWFCLVVNQSTDYNRRFHSGTSELQLVQQIKKQPRSQTNKLLAYKWIPIY